MPTFELSGPDGGTYHVEAPDEHAAVSALGSMGNVSRETSAPAQQPAAPPSTDVPMGEGLMRSAVSGAPILGGLANKAAAGAEALAGPVLDKLGLTSKFGSAPEDAPFSDRYQRALDIQNQRDKSFREAHPIASMAAEIGGGIASVGGALKAAPKVTSSLLGLTGKTLPQQVVRGAVGGAGLSTADALTREGTDPGTAAEVGAITGAAGPVVGRLVGKGIDAVQGLRRPAAVPANVADVSGIPVRQSLGQATGDTEAITREQMALRGADNSQEQGVARDFFDAQKGELGQARDAVAGRMSPTGEVVASNPQDAASVIADSLRTRGQTQFQTEQAAAGRLAADTEALHNGLSPTGTQLAANPTEAANIVGQSVGNAAERAQAATKQAYDKLRALPGQFHPAAFNGVGDEIAASLNKGSEPIKVNSQTTPQAAMALRDIDEVVGGLGQTRNEAGQIMPKPPTTPAVVEDARKRLNTFYGDALQAARSSNNWSDVRAMRGVINGFDDAVTSRLTKAGQFAGGDPADVASTMRWARGLNTEYRKTFTPQGSGDEVGPAIQKIVGRFDGQAAPPEQIRGMLYGSGALPVKIAQRLTNVFGQDSPEIGAVKQGLLSHLTEAADGSKFAPEKAAANINGFLKNSTLAQVYLKPAERQAFAAHADRLAGSVKGAPTDVEKVVARIADGSLSPTDVANVLMTTKGVGRSVQLAQKIKSEFGGDSREWAALKQGMWAKVSETTGGPLDVGSRKVVTQLTQLLDGDGKPLSHVMFGSDERDLIRSYRDLMDRITPPAGTVNYSNTASVLGKMFRGALDGIFGLGGLHIAGPVGMAAGFAAHAGQKAIQDTVRATKVAKSLYGTPQGAAAAEQLQQSLAQLSAVVARGASPRLAAAQ